MDARFQEQYKRRSDVSRKGFSLVTAALMAIGAIGMVGLAVDLGLLYIAKSEVQAFTDSAALAATLELDGTQEGFSRAIDEVLRDPNRWMLGTREFTEVEIAFAKETEGPWEASPADAQDYKLVRVHASVPVPVFFMSILRGKSSGITIGGMSFLQLPSMSVDVTGDSGSGQLWRRGLRQGTFPFSPLAHNDVAPHYGLVVGEQHTLRWAANPRVNQNMCSGDNSQYMVDLVASDGGNERGYIEESSSDVIRMAIEQDYQTVYRGIGDTVHMTGGAKQTQLTSLIRRVHQDTDHDSMTYADYVTRGAGNGRRIVSAPINTGYPDYLVVQMGGFFLLPESEYSNGGNKPFCAEYIGAWVQGAKQKGAGESGAYVARLLE